MKIEDHGTWEIWNENYKRSSVCFECGLVEHNYRGKDRETETHISTTFTDPSSKRRDAEKFVWMCKKCKKKMYHRWHIEGLEENIDYMSEKINNIKKPSCDKCQINAMHNPSHLTCGDCGAKAYDDCVCDLFHIEKIKMWLKNAIKNDCSGPMGKSRSGGIVGISYAYELIFTCPVHGEQKGRVSEHIGNKFYKVKK